MLKGGHEIANSRLSFIDPVRRPWLFLGQARLTRYEMSWLNDCCFVLRMVLKEIRDDVE